MVAKFRTSYFDGALDDLPGVVERAKAELADVDFDTIVGTGFSGGVVIPMLATAMGKDFLLIRKESDDSHHGPGRLLGRLGRRWIFVDDLISSGTTRDRVFAKVKAAASVEDHITTYVGNYLYASYGDTAFNGNVCPECGQADGLHAHHDEPETTTLVADDQPVNESQWWTDTSAANDEPVALGDDWVDVGYTSVDEAPMFVAYTYYDAASDILGPYVDTIKLNTIGGL